jgi:SOS-response transcriptional repressor LexA
MKDVLGIEKDKDIAAYFGVNPQLIYNWKARGTIPLDQCVKLRFEKGVSLDWLLLGIGDGEPVPGHTGPGTDRDYTEVPLYDVEASAGNGSFFNQEQISSYLKFRNDWLTREGLHQKDLVAIRVSGDSMDGTLADGDTVLIDRSRKKPDGVFAIRIGDSLRIKRLQKMTDGSIRLSSDNPIYQPEVIHPENMSQVEIVGQCYWRGGRVF